MTERPKKPPEPSSADFMYSAQRALEARNRPLLPAASKPYVAVVPSPPPAVKAAPPAISKSLEEVLKASSEPEEEEEGEEEEASETSESEYDLPKEVELVISDELSLPVETVTQSIAVVAQKGAGKTYTTIVMSEEMVQNGLPLIIVDPLGVYWGLRSTADGEGMGVDIKILGGDHADVPLDPGSGRAIARWVIKHREAAILDISIMRKSEQRIFVADFAEELYEKSRKDKTPLHLIVDEADLFIPQRPEPEQKRGLGAFEDIVRRGRVRGLGITVVTQRPAVLHKDILTQVGILVVMRMMGPQDRDAISEWIHSHDDPVKQRMVLNSLASLPTGTAWIWSPSWLGLLKKVPIRNTWTFDSSKTPKIGVPAPEPNVRREINVDGLRNALGDAIRNDPDDPRNLKLRIRELERTLDARSGDEAGAIVFRLKKRITQLEHQLLARGNKGAGDAVSVDGNLLASEVLEAQALRASVVILTERLEMQTGKVDRLLLEMSASESIPDEEKPETEEESDEDIVEIEELPDEEPEPPPRKAVRGPIQRASGRKKH